MSPHIQMIIAGICLATWQILVNASGMPGPVANLWVLILSALFAVGTAVYLTSAIHVAAQGMLTVGLFLAVVLAFRHVVPASAMTYAFGAAAGVLSGIAVWQLNDVLSSVPKTEVGALLVLMMLAQISTASMFHIGAQAYLLGAVSPRTLTAFALALLAGFLLNR